MVHRNVSKGSQPKPRGRPFQKGNKRGKPKDSLLDSSRHQSSIERGAIEEEVKPSNVENEKESILFQLPKLVVDGIDKMIEENLNFSSGKEESENKALEKIESLDFNNGENTLSIRFSKRHNRMFRIQIFLNETTEIRPVTYTGANTGYAFWNLLKGNMKK